MPKANTKKTVSVPSRHLLIIVTIIGLILIWAGISQKTMCPFKLDNNCVALEPAATSELRAQGLSGRVHLAEHAGMLFVFDVAGRQCMWMRDMKFSLDIIWLNQDKRINKIEQNVPPDTYPRSFCGDHAKYVIEINAKTAESAGLQLGQKLNF